MWLELESSNGIAIVFIESIECAKPHVAFAVLDNTPYLVTRKAMLIGQVFKTEFLSLPFKASELQHKQTYKKENQMRFHIIKSNGKEKQSTNTAAKKHLINQMH
jgi:hypothetical protein